MFKIAPQLDPGGPSVRFRFEGRELRAPEGMNLAAALLSNGELAFRESPVTGAARGPFCLMGACFECLVVIDGKAGRQACMVAVAENMEVHRQRRPQSELERELEREPGSES
ncbi:MAG: (2Fe-2S)-binding protein [Alphaproteobacteria bacterium]